MSNKSQTPHYKGWYEPLSQKSLRNILKRELMEQFGFENMGLIADALINRFLKLMSEYTLEHKQILPGQILWLAVSKDDKPSVSKPIWKSKLIPVVLTIVKPEDLQEMVNKRQNHVEMRSIFVSRILKEAYQQGGVLGLHDVAVLLGISQPAVRRAVENHRKEHPDEILPYRGTIHDMGGTTTHKIQVVEMKLLGLLTQEIARKIHHDPESVDIYQTDFERVHQLFKDGKDVNQIAFLTKISRSVVSQYIDLINTYVKEPNN